MRLSHIADKVDQCDAGDHKRCAFQIVIFAPQGGKTFIDVDETCVHAGKAAHIVNADRDQDEESYDHQDGLHEVGIGNGEVAPGSGIDQYGDSSQDQGNCIIESCYAGNENSHGHKFHQK